MALQGLQGDTRIHNIKPNHDWRFNDLVFRGLQDILKSCREMKKLQKPKTWGSALCDISEFEENEKKCVCFLYNCLQFLQLYSFTYTTNKPSHHNHSIIPLSNHHTIIIPKSHVFRNILYFCDFLWLFSVTLFFSTVWSDLIWSDLIWSDHLLNLFVWSDVTFLTFLTSNFWHFWHFWRQLLTIETRTPSTQIAS